MVAAGSLAATCNNYCSPPPSCQHLFTSNVSYCHTGQQLAHHGLHSTGQAAEAQRVQVLWCRPQFNVALRDEAFLQQRCHQLLPHVDGVSQ